MAKTNGSGAWVRWAMGGMATAGIAVAIFVLKAQANNGDIDREQDKDISTLKSDVGHLKEQSNRIETNTDLILEAVRGG